MIQNIENMRKNEEIEATFRRGRPVKKVFQIEPGQLIRIKKRERGAFLLQAKKNGWNVRTKSQGDKVLVFREVDVVR